MIVNQVIAGAISNRIRGSSYRIGFLNQDDINAILFACMFATVHWQLLVLYIAMRLGSATGWTEGICGCFNTFNLHEGDYNWISKIVKPVNQLTTFLYMCIRALIWIIALQLGLYLCGAYSVILWLAVPLFYCSSVHH